MWSKQPANATGTTLSLVPGTATIATGTAIDNTTGVIAIAPAQTGGGVVARADQTITHADGSSSSSWFTSPPVSLAAIPTGIASTAGSLRSVADAYGGDFTHTFQPPAGSSASALENARVNENFAAASGTTLTLRGTLGTFTITINDPATPASGWDLDASGTMMAADEVDWTHAGPDARRLVVNASNRAPANRLPQELVATQTFRNLTYPARTWGTTNIATLTHRRAFEERGNRIKAVTSANRNEVVEDYAGPTVFRRGRANPASMPATAPTPPGGPAPTASTSTIQVDTEGEAATPTYSIQGPALGCTIDAATGVLTAGPTAGAVTVRGGDATNFDEATVTITAAVPTPTPTPTPPTPTPTPTPPNPTPPNPTPRP